MIITKNKITNVPKELQELKQWVLVGDKKIPYQTSGKLAKCSDKGTWDSFENCLEVLSENSQYKGLGFELSMDDNFVFIDIDKMDINTEEKLNFIDNFSSYTEKSQSGNGYHIIIKVNNKHEFLEYAKELNLCDINSGTKKTLSCKQGDYEIYISDRYFWLTGDIVDSKTSINLIDTDELVETFEFIESKKLTNHSLSHSVSNVNKKSPELTNEEIIKLCNKAKNSHKFKELWNEEGKQGNSEGDQSLLNLLGFYTQDVDQLCELMRMSKRNRSKFDRLDYLKRSALKAIESVDKVYDPNISTDSDILKVLEQGAKLPQDLKELPWILKEENEKTGKIKKTILCPVLADFLRHNLKYLFVKEGAKDQIQRYIYSKGYYKSIVDDEFKGFIKQYIPLDLQKIKDITEILNLIYTDLKFESYTNINPENYINFRNGLFNIKTWKMEQHTPDIYTTIQIPCDYNPNMKPLENSVFDYYIDHLSTNNEDTKKLIKQFMGITISNIHAYRMKKALFMVGKGNTGKSQVKELLIKLIGNVNANTCDLDSLEKRFGTSNIFNKRLAGSNDMGFMTVKELKVFKQMVAGDTLNFEFKGENTFTGKYNGVTWFCCNELPKFGGDKGDWVYERILVINCDNPVKKKDSELLDKMYKEKDYIIWQLMNSLKEVLNNEYEYNVPNHCKLALDNYKISNDSVLSFLKDCTILIDNTKELKKDITVSNIYKIYKKWCDDNNNKYSENKIKFKKILESKGLGKIKKTNGIRYYEKFTLNDESIEEYGDINIF